MNKLKQSDVIALSQLECKKLLNTMQDKACNIDYIKNPIESDIIQSNINLLESKILYNEY